MFGLAHYDQGWDVAMSVGVLGVIWGLIYMKRRSSILAMANHAGFNGVQVAVGSGGPIARPSVNAASR